jgi:hypothetical protein
VGVFWGEAVDSGRDRGFLSFVIAPGRVGWLAGKGDFAVRTPLGSFFQIEGLYGQKQP